ncbi:unnamed protein product [Vicia faba]|uniref:Uncharacterized protein n=1 Tax=Vicia faba TaxID=3906 RepID=A0AAV1A3T1_VICFA|nr:unnamed protein product [Vicia faba]
MLRSCFSSHLKAAFLHLSEKSFITSLNSSYRLRFFTVDSFSHFPITIQFTTPFFLLSLPSSRYPNQLCAKFQSTLFLYVIEGTKHNEFDFEFFGNNIGEPYSLQFSVKESNSLDFNMLDTILHQFKGSSSSMYNVEYYSKNIIYIVEKIKLPCAKKIVPSDCRAMIGWQVASVAKC